MKEKLDIKFKNGELSSELSNLYPYRFVYGGYEMASMEGFLQSLKTQELSVKIPIFDTFGYEAWKNGQRFNWQEKQELYWIETPINRHSKEYIKLISSAYDALYEQNEHYRDAIQRSLEYKLDHSIGNTDSKMTIMTRKEYLYQMNRMQKKAKNKFFDLSSIFNF